LNSINVSLDEEEEESESQDMEWWPCCLPQLTTTRVWRRPRLISSRGKGPRFNERVQPSRFIPPSKIGCVDSCPRRGDGHPFGDCPQTGRIYSLSSRLSRVKSVRGIELLSIAPPGDVVSGISSHVILWKNGQSLGL
jgi:hypothetical protein